MNVACCIALLAAVALGLCSPATAELGAWFAPSALKVLRDVKPTKAHKWELAAARNEVEACQLVLLSDKALSGVRISVSELRHTRVEASLKAELNKVEYVPNVVKDTPYPDPLPPLKPLDLQPNRAQPVWISVRVPKDAAPGTYRGTVTVQAGRQKLELPLSVHVWDFALPDTPSCVTAFGIFGGIARVHGVEEGSTAYRELYAKYYEMLLDHKVSAYTLPADVMSDAVARYMDDPRMTSYTIPYPADDAELRKIVARLIEKDWFRKGYWYPIDEPVNKDAYDRFSQICERLRSVEPRYRIVTPFFRNPDFGENPNTFDTMLGKANIWCCVSSYLDAEPTARKRMAERKNAGDAVWWYVCCGPGEPYNNFFVQMPAMSHRVLFWQQRREGLQGLLYWSTTWWNPNDGCDDPWESMMTVRSINPDIRGDGSLFYPGKRVGIDGPVSSQRLECIRDGAEDFEYLTLADQRLGPGAAAQYVARICTSLKEWEHDPLKLEAVRRELGEALEKATVGARKGI